MRLIDEIGEPALLELMAEECTELAQAALKLARVMRGENPTPRETPECREKVMEETADVTVVMTELCEAKWFDMLKMNKIMDKKIARMRKRIRRGHGS